MLKRVFCVTAFVLVAAMAQGQTLGNLMVSFDGEKLSISYDLNDADPNQKYKVLIYSSYDNYANPLSLVIGDYGESVVPGKRKHVIWDAKETLPQDFDRDIQIRLKATKILAPALNMKPLAYNVYKKGKNVDIAWLGGIQSDKLNIDLLKGKGNEVELVESIAKNVENRQASQNFSWSMPKSAKAGKKYFIRLSKADKPAEQTSSQFFDIKPRTPFIVKALPFLAAGAAVVLLTGGSKSDNSSTALAELPGPTKP
jgi:hypothetical protein